MQPAKATNKTINLETVDGWAILPSSLKRPDRSPRFHLYFAANFAADVGAQHLIVNEAGDGYEPATRDLIERVLRRGDVFVDVGAHWGFFSLQAATHPAGDIDVIAFEPDLMNATMLNETVGRNRLSNRIAVVGAACGNKNELAPLVANSTMGHSIRGVGLTPDAQARSKWVPVVTLDSALANMGLVDVEPADVGPAGTGKPAQRRLIVKIDAEGFEPNVILGAQSLLASGRVALVVWECGRTFADGVGRRAMQLTVTLLSECGFRHFQPPASAHGGPPVAFDAEANYRGNVFSVGPQLINDPIFHSAAA
jgi:FkbM family methyltransferase